MLKYIIWYEQHTATTWRILAFNGSTMMMTIIMMRMSFCIASKSTAWDVKPTLCGHLAVQLIRPTRVMWWQDNNRAQPSFTALHAWNMLVSVCGGGWSGGRGCRNWLRRDMCMWVCVRFSCFNSTFLHSYKCSESHNSSRNSVKFNAFSWRGIGQPLSFHFSSLLLPGRWKTRNRLRARVMIDDTPPPANTSLLTHCCFSALIGRACTLSSRCMWISVLSKPPTQRIAWARLLWLSTDHKPCYMSEACKMSTVLATRSTFAGG